MAIPSKHPTDGTISTNYDSMITGLEGTPGQMLQNLHLCVADKSHIQQAPDR